MKALTLCFIILSHLLCATASQASFENVGIGAKPMGMGGAYTALAKDTHAIVWNPAGLADIAQREIGVSYLELYGLVGYSFIAAAQSLTDIGVVAVGLSGSNDPAGNYQEFALNVSAARQVFSKLNLGLNLKYLSSQAGMGEITVGSSHGLALDLGMQYDIWNERVHCGISLPNVLSYLSYNREELKHAQARQYNEALLREYRLGFAIELDELHKSLSQTQFSCELADGNVLLGIEKQIQHAAIRAGYRFSKGLSNGITFGLGYRIYGFQIDYAYVQGRYDSPTSQFSVTLYY